MAVELAQVNVSRLLVPLGSPQLAEFMGRPPSDHRRAEDRVRHLRRHGPTPTAFTFRKAFASPGQQGVVRTDDGWLCPA